MTFSFQSKVASPPNPPVVLRSSDQIQRLSHKIRQVSPRATFYVGESNETIQSFLEIATQPTYRHALLTLLTATPQTPEFQPQMDSSVAVAASIAAIPPILFWARVLRAEQRRRQEVEDKERARQELKKKLFGK